MLLAVLLVQVDLLQARLCQMLGRSLYIDEHTAKFYLEDSGGDIKAAMEAFGEHTADALGGQAFCQCSSAPQNRSVHVFLIFISAADMSATQNWYAPRCTGHNGVAGTQPRRTGGLPE